MSNDESLEANPFAALFPSMQDAKEYISSCKQPLQHQEHWPGDIGASESQVSSSSSDVKSVLSINLLIENIFLVTLDDDNVPSSRPRQLVFLQELRLSLHDREWIGFDILDQVVFERVMLTDASAHLVETGGSAASENAVTDQVLAYLYECYLRCERQKNRSKMAEESWLAQCEHAIIANARMCLQLPALYGDNETVPASVMLNLYKTEHSGLNQSSFEKFFTLVAGAIAEHTEEGTDLATCLGPMLDMVLLQMKSISLDHPDTFVYADLLVMFARCSRTAVLLIGRTAPDDWNSGVAYQRTLLGQLLALHCLPSSPAGPFEYFEKPSTTPKRDIELLEENIHRRVTLLNVRLYEMCYSLLRHGGEARHLLLDWLARCVGANRNRAKLIAHTSPAVFSQMYVSDSFAINLCEVLMRLSAPFSQPYSSKLSRVRPSYVLATAQRTLRPDVHMRDIASETCLVPTAEGESRGVVEASYSFVCECFFLTQVSLHLGVHVVREKFMKLNQELHRVQSLWNDIQAQGGTASPVGERVKAQMETGMSYFLSLKAALTSPALLEHSFQCTVSTATYLCHAATSFVDGSPVSRVSFPLPDTPTPALKLLPEFLVENITDFMVFIKRFKAGLYDEHGGELAPLLSLVLVFMGSPQRMANPHLRASLAEALEALLPHKTGAGMSELMPSSAREQLLVQHPDAARVAETLLSVFVSIEMTGQGVQFEQKFNYRRPMYAILEHIWGVPLHREAVKRLCSAALRQMDAPDAPLFLRFVNLLINDAIFLLDEALQYMAQLRDMEAQRDGREWEGLSEAQQREHEGNHHQVGMLARFHNLMGRDTLHSLQLLTHEVQDIFWHDVIVHRTAAMLNYFLLHLVGPKKRNLKVKDLAKYEFKPSELVAIIAKIYLQLGSSDVFCAAVASDGRSYSHQLFSQAEAVLHKIQQPPNVIMEFNHLGNKIKGVSVELAAEDEALADAPDEFLDPIMGTLLRDPVVLPSGNTVSRATIARHLLSDQTDPFNRQPLTMEMVRPALELQARIDTWLAARPPS